MISNPNIRALNPENPSTPNASSKYNLLKYCCNSLDALFPTE